MIFCTKCNTALDDDAVVCTNCGTEIEPPVIENYEVAPATEEVNDCVDEKKVSKLSTDVLLWGILSLVSSLAISPILGIIFSCIGIKPKKELKAMVGQLEGSAKIGNALSLTALAYSIYSLVIIAAVIAFYVLYFAFFFIVVLSTTGM